MLACACSHHRRQKHYLCTPVVCPRRSSGGSPGLGESGCRGVGCERCVGSRRHLRTRYTLSGNGPGMPLEWPWGLGRGASAPQNKAHRR